MVSQFQSERIGGVRPERGSIGSAKRRRARRSPPRQRFDQRERHLMQPRAVTGKLELVRGIAEEGMAEEIGGLSIHEAAMVNSTCLRR